MRSDTNLNRRFAAEGVDTRAYGSMPGVLDTSTEQDGQRLLRSHSFSGSEPNSVFFNRGGRAFDDLSGVSGLDSAADGRSFAYFDYDHDGRTDIVLANSNRPQLQLFRNEIEDAGHWVQVRLVGGNSTAAANPGWSARDGYGAHVLVETSAGTLRRELRCGDGFAAQNSRVLHVGIGRDTAAAGITVEWPSGKRSTAGPVASGNLLTVFEDGGDGADFAGAVAEAAARMAPAPSRPRLDLGLPAEYRREVAVVVSVATWCPVCAAEIPRLRDLSRRAGDRFSFFGLPVDPDDDAGKLAGFRERHGPPYRVLEQVTAPQRESFESAVAGEFGTVPLPSTLLLDRDGHVLGTFLGTPTLSELRRALE